MSKLFTFILTIALGGLFVFSGSIKIFDPASFAQDIANFRIMPHKTINLVAITLPWLEWVTGSFMLVGIWVRANAVIIAGLMMVFIIAVASALIRGLNIECGCFGSASAGPIGLAKLAENTLLFLMALWIAWKAKS